MNDNDSRFFDTILSHWGAHEGTEALLSRVDKDGRTLLHRASVLDRRDIIAIIFDTLRHERRDEIILIQDQFGETALHWANSKQVVDLLLSSISTNSKRNELMWMLNTTEHTALNEAALRGQTGVVEELFEKVPGYSQNAFLLHHDSNGYSLLSRAARSGNPDTADYVIGCYQCCMTQRREYQSYVQKLGLSSATPFHHLVSHRCINSVASLLLPLAVEERRCVLSYKNASGSNPKQLARVPTETLKQTGQITLYYDLPVKKMRNTTDLYHQLKVLHLFCNEYACTKPRLLLFSPDSSAWIISDCGKLHEVKVSYLEIPIIVNISGL